MRCCMQVACLGIRESDWQALARATAQGLLHPSTEVLTGQKHIGDVLLRDIIHRLSQQGVAGLPHAIVLADAMAAVVCATTTSCRRSCILTFLVVAYAGDKQVLGNEVVTGSLWAALQGRHAMAAEAFCDLGLPDRAVQMYAEHGQAAEAGALAAQLGLDLSRLVLSSGPAPSTQRDMRALGAGSAGHDEVEDAAEARLKACAEQMLLCCDSARYAGSVICQMGHSA